MVKIEPVWEEMENSCSLGLDAREADESSQDLDRQLRHRILGSHPSFARL